MAPDARRTSRRTLLTAGGAGLIFSAAAGARSSAATAPVARSTVRRAYVVVVDGCRPDEITPTLTPRLADLRAAGRNFPRATSLPVMETIPNHVMMMAGLRPDRTGVPANEVYDRAAGAVRTLDRPTDLRSSTVIDRADAAGLTTGTVLSKEYLYGIFGERATYRWEPGPLVPVSGHAPDVFTMDATLAMVEDLDPHLVFVNLGDIDRFGHADLTGSDLRLARTLALADTDAQVGRLVQLLHDSGRWEHSLLVLLADHAMDWSRPGRVVSLTPALEADPVLAGRVAVADNGGADLLYWTGPAALRDEAVTRMRDVASSVEGVLVTHDRREESLRLGPEAGDVLVWCRAGWRFSEPDVTGNPVPGNHGHPATYPIPFFVSGGHRAVRAGTTSSARAHTVDVAPTVGEFLGVGGPAGGYDGRSRL
ncbi:alkaline phosphatase family protein [Nocardioides taihuensis]|uniref:Alkaline phosphatase family protein n=1 Tax=Nocardioides taihuensis TaxID=1835606 RepID=A0ABW0BKM2_9ACTN